MLKPFVYVFTVQFKCNRQAWFISKTHLIGLCTEPFAQIFVVVGKNAYSVHVEGHTPSLPSLNCTPIPPVSEFIQPEDSHGWEQNTWRFFFF